MTKLLQHLVDKGTATVRLKENEKWKDETECKVIDNSDRRGGSFSGLCDTRSSLAFKMGSDRRGTKDVASWR